MTKLTEKQRHEIKEKQCKKCMFVGVNANGNASVITCDYILFTGKMRNCSPVKCERFKEGARIKTDTRPKLARRKSYRGDKRAQRSKTEFGKWFCNRLDVIRVSNANVASALGFSLNRIGSLTRGTALPKDDEVAAIAKYFHGDVDMLIKIRDHDRQALKKSKSRRE